MDFSKPPSQQQYQSIFGKIYISSHPMDRKTLDRILFLLLRSSKLRNGSEGYAMLITSIMAILVFSLLSVYLFSTRLYRASSEAIVDGGSTFYAAESGMNKRASSAHAKFVGFSQPVGTTPLGGTVLERMNNCISGVPASQGTGDFACDSKDYDYYEQIDGATNIIDTAKKADRNKVKYTAYTFIQPNLNNPIQRKIPGGEPWAGLNTLTYNYRIYSTAVRQNVNGSMPVAAQSLLNLEFNSNVIPLFQFAAFYENDLEINPTPNMSINGPVHTNSKLFMAPGGDLALQGNVTSTQDMYNSMEFISYFSRSTNRILLANGNAIDTGIAWSQANHLIDPNDITSSGGQLRPRVDRLDVPQPGFLSKIDPSNGQPGEYYDKADLRVEFTPKTDLKDIPFKVAPKGLGGIPTDLADNFLRSLRQPVMANTASDDEQRAFCGSIQTAPASLTSLGLTTAEENDVMAAMYGAVLAQPRPVPYSSLAAPLADIGGNNLRTTFQGYLNLSLGGAKKKKQAKLSAARITAIMAATPKDIVSMGGNCFLPAPFQVVTVNDRREGRNIQVLQTNIQSLTVWNRDGRTKDFDAAGNATDPNDEIGDPVNSDIFARNAADVSAPIPSMRRFGLAGADRSEGGFVWHFNVDKTAFPYPAKQSIYGFGFSGGQDLPNALTIATDQAIYLQGDYNTTDRKPAAAMGDTIAVLSNACRDPDLLISCGNLTAGALPVATPTTVNAAFLSRTDATDVTKSPLRYSGGLNNYIRMLEDWQNVPLTYLGSFISLGTPQEFSGTYLPGRVGAPNLTNIASLGDYSYYYPPLRNFSFDTSFNNAVGLPPLTPKVVSLSQKVFKRDYNSNR
jgi:hypothetical protein